LLQFGKGRIDPRKDRSLPELREDALCLDQMLNREGTLFLGLVKQADNHFCAPHLMSRRIEMRILQNARNQGSNVGAPCKHDLQKYWQIPQ
jgi:hypothetical protein